MANDPSTTADPNEDDLPRLFEHPVVVFPIHNRRSTASAAIGTLLRDVHESDVLTSAKGIEFAPESALECDSTLHWHSDASIST